MNINKSLLDINKSLILMNALFVHFGLPYRCSDYNPKDVLYNVMGLLFGVRKKYNCIYERDIHTHINVTPQLRNLHMKNCNTTPFDK